MQNEWGDFGLLQLCSNDPSAIQHSSWAVPQLATGTIPHMHRGWRGRALRSPCGVSLFVLRGEHSLQVPVADSSGRVIHINIGEACQETSV